MRCSLKRLRSAFAVLLIIAVPFHSIASDSVPAYRVTRSVALGAPDRWDYVVFDPASERVFVAHGDEVTVVDGNDGTVLGHIQGLPGGTHGIAIADPSGRGYTDDGKAGEAVSFDLRTFTVERRVRAVDADAVIYDPYSRHVFVVNGDTETLTVIDPAADAIISTISVQGSLEYAVAEGHGNLYVNGAERQEVVRVNTISNKVTARWPVSQCARPHGLALDPTTRRLFISCVNSVLVVLNADTGKTVDTLPIGRGSDAAVFDPVRRLILSSNGRDGTLSIIREVDAEHFVSLGNVKTSMTARTMAINPKTGRIFLAEAELSHPETAAAAGTRAAILPGSLKLLFIDPPD